MNGWKTYFIAASTIIGAIAAYLQGSIGPDIALQTIITAILSITIRHGITTEVSKK